MSVKLGFDDISIRQDEWHLVQQDRDSFLQELTAKRHRDAYQYWLTRSPDNRLPAREDLDPVDIHKLLPWINLVDVVREKGTVRLRQRLIGTGLVQRFGRDATGAWFDDIYHPDYLQDHCHLIREVAETGLPSLTRIRYPDQEKRHVIYTRLMLPLASDHKTTDMIMQVMVFD